MFLAPLALGYILFSEATQNGAIGVMPGAMLLIVPLAGVMTAVPQLLFSKGVNKTPLSLTGIFMYVNPTMQMLIGVLLYHEAFTTACLLYTSSKSKLGR